MKIKISLAQIYPRLGDIEYNIRRHIEISKEVRNRAQLLIFPELSLTGFNLMDLTQDIAQERDSRLLKPILEASKDIDIILGLVELGLDKSLYNSAFYYSNLSLKSIQRKLFLSTHIGRPKYFESGEKIEVINTNWGNLGIIIGEDILNPLVMIPFIRNRVKVLIVMSNSISTGYSDSNLGIPKSSIVLKDLLSNYAQLYSMYILYVNRVGFEDGLNFFGGSCVIDPYGEVIVSSPYFEESIVDVELDLEAYKVASNLFDFDKAYEFIRGILHED